MNLLLSDPAFLSVAATVSGGGGYDADAQAYITAVETADAAAGSPGGLETAVKDAINAFVVGCKTDGIWNAIKASCVLAGARTLNGALVPLVGAAPTNYNFVGGDYDRKTGLVGDGSTKYLDSNRPNNADPQDSNHNAVFPTALGVAAMLSTAGGQATGNNLVGLNGLRSRNYNDDVLATGSAGRLRGTNRSASGSFTARTDGFNTVFTRASETPQNSNLVVLSGSTHRLAFYSIGESLDLALLDARVTTLINAFAAAIP